MSEANFRFSRNGINRALELPSINESGSPSIGIEPPSVIVCFDVCAFVSSLIEVIAEVIGSEIDMGMSFEPQMPRALTDPDSLELLLLNLIAALYVAMPGGGNILFRTSLVRRPAFGDSKPRVCLAIDGKATDLGLDLLPQLLRHFFVTKPGRDSAGHRLVRRLLAQCNSGISLTATRRGTASVNLWLPVA